MTRDLRISLMLGSCALVLGGVMLWQHFGLGAHYQLAKATEPATPIKVGKLQAVNANLPPWPDYMAVVNKPLFNESRKPEEEDKPAEAPAPQAPPLTGTLTSVLMTEKLKMALIRDPNTQKVMRIREGANLEGEFAQWRLVELRGRSAVFEAAGQRQELQLTAGSGQVASSSPSGMGSTTPPPPPPSSPQTPSNGAVPLVMGQPSEPQPAYQNPNADEIRRRIEERRRQLREEARRMMEQQKQ